MNDCDGILSRCHYGMCEIIIIIIIIITIIIIVIIIIFIIIIILFIFSTLGIKNPDG